MLTKVTPEGEIVSDEETAEVISAAKLARDIKLASVERLVNLIPPLFKYLLMRADTGLRSNIGEKLPLSVVGQNLLHDHRLVSNVPDQIVVSSMGKRSGDFDRRARRF